MKFTVHIITLLVRLPFLTLWGFPPFCIHTSTHSDNLHVSVTASAPRRSNKAAAVECEGSLWKVNLLGGFSPDNCSSIGLWSCDALV